MSKKKGEKKKKASSSVKYLQVSPLLSISVLRGSEELSGVQAETERPELQVLLNEQQVAGQPPQFLRHHQGTTHTLASKCTGACTYVERSTFDILSPIFSRIQTDSCRM